MVLVVHLSEKVGRVFVSALRRRQYFGGGAPGDFDRRRVDRFFSAATASVKYRRRRRDSQ